MSDTLIVNEIFGPTIQGEGPTAGMPCAFLRLGGCNQHCSFCDTPYTWAFSAKLAELHEDRIRFEPRRELKKLSQHTVTKTLMAMEPPVYTLVISGGEPLLQQERLIPLLSELLALRKWRVEIETAGTIVPVPQLQVLVTQFNVSPKLENSGNEKGLRYQPEALNTLQATGKSVFKFVVTSHDDWNEIDTLVMTHALHPVYIMPEARSPESYRKHAQAVISGVIERGYILTPRLQIEIWGNIRGV